MEGLELLAASAYLARRRGDLEAALRAGEEHLACAEETGNPFFLIGGLYNMVQVHGCRGEAGKAREALDRA